MMDGAFTIGTRTDRNLPVSSADGQGISRPRSPGLGAGHATRLIGGKFEVIEIALWEITNANRLPEGLVTSANCLETG